MFELDEWMIQFRAKDQQGNELIEWNDGFKLYIGHTEQRAVVLMPEWRPPVLSLRVRLPFEETQAA